MMNSAATTALGLPTSFFLEEEEEREQLWKRDRRRDISASALT